ncbi:MAG TPA: response regulator [Allocoleopsis sp.]
MFTALKPIQFLEKLKRLQFSGQLVLTAPQGQEWSLYFYLGSIMYATGGIHPVRRWRRNLLAYCPQLPAQSAEWQRELSRLNTTAFNTCWEYELLCLWEQEQKIPREQVDRLIRSVITEVLFDVAQAMQVTSQVKEDSSLSTSLRLIDVQEAIAEAYQLWQVWRNAMVADYSLNTAPIIKQPEKLRERTSAPVYQNLSRVLNGQYTLRDLALLMKRDVMEVAKSLQFYIQLGLVELINVPDLAAPVKTPVAKKPKAIATPGGFLVACVDDSPLVCQTMEALLVAAGYQFVGVNDALRAFSILLTRKPDLVFLDLVMPNTNGYEICSKLRKLPSFQNTPIVILTGNDGIVDRVRAKLVGASDFLSKPVDAETVLGVIRKHLRQEAIRN